MAGVMTSMQMRLCLLFLLLLPVRVAFRIGFSVFFADSDFLHMPA